MATGDGSTLEGCLQFLKTNTAHPEQFLSVQDALGSDFISLTKTLYDLHKCNEPAYFKGSPLGKLVTENFDEEQIWQELELQNNPLLTFAEQAVEQALTDDTITFLEEEDEDEEEDEEEEKKDVDEEKTDDLDVALEQDESEEETHQRLKPSEEEDLSGEDSDLDFDVDKFEKQSKQKQPAGKLAKPKSKGFASAVDDRFFKLSDMEAFLDDMDKREGKESHGQEVNYFRDLSSDEDEGLIFDKPAEDTKQKKKKSSRDMKYKDFFDPVEEQTAHKYPDEENELESNDDSELFGEEDGDELEEEGDMNEEDSEMEEYVFVSVEDEMGDSLRNGSRKVTFDLPDDSEGEDVEDILGGKAKDGPKPENKSTFEKRQEKVCLMLVAVLLMHATGVPRFTGLGGL
ncbi:hypothetical protein DNTS_014303 [Danionella cerebrum]|uniref:Uncharacterized protein n=1 Tax=Danionella cerebrum TaxID=2873325 RepID=A0A553RN66_9TELE|nr:hypothetical protein DNTS_014303 [Danionella translucida]